MNLSNLPLLDLILSVEQRPLLLVPLLFQFVHLFLCRDFALQIPGESLRFLGLADFQFDVLEFALQIVLEVIRPGVELVGLGIEERLVAALRFHQHAISLRLYRRLQPGFGRVIDRHLGTQRRGNRQQLFARLPVEHPTIVGDTGDEQRLLRIERVHRELLDVQPSRFAAQLFNQHDSSATTFVVEKQFPWRERTVLGPLDQTLRERMAGTVMEIGVGLASTVAHLRRLKLFRSYGILHAVPEPGRCAFHAAIHW